MLENYPKKRPKLSKELLHIYDTHYKSNRDGSTTASGLAQKMERWLHQKVSNDVDRMHNKKTLEIGAGTLNQLSFEESSHYDIIEPYSKLYKDSKFLSKINRIYNDIDDIDISAKYDRITSIATFEHITDLPKVVAKSCVLLEEGGHLRTSIPNEGTFLWKLGYTLTTGLEFRLKYGLRYSELMRYEHVNSAKEIGAILDYFFEENKCSVFGISKNFSFYRFYESATPNLDRAKSYLDKYNAL